MAEYAWTHWATLWGPDGQDENKEVNEPMAETVLYRAEVVAASGGTVNLRAEPNGRRVGSLKKVSQTPRPAGRNA